MITESKHCVAAPAAEDILEENNTAGAEPENAGQHN